jgi:hypothetical protein
MQDVDDVLAYPLEVPEDGGHHSLWKLREELLRVGVGDDEWRACRAEDLHSVAGLVISHLFSDENTGTPWDSGNGVPPNVMWTPPPVGGAIPALPQCGHRARRHRGAGDLARRTRSDGSLRSRTRRHQ